LRRRRSARFSRSNLGLGESAGRGGPLFGFAAPGADRRHPTRGVSAALADKAGGNQGRSKFVNSSVRQIDYKSTDGGPVGAGPPAHPGAARCGWGSRAPRVNIRGLDLPPNHRRSMVDVDEKINASTQKLTTDPKWRGLVSSCTVYGVALCTPRIPSTQGC
jgi:hypothetical protein